MIVLRVRYSENQILMRNIIIALFYHELLIFLISWPASQH